MSGPITEKSFVQLREMLFDPGGIPREVVDKGPIATGRYIHAREESWKAEHKRLSDQLIATQRELTAKIMQETRPAGPFEADVKLMGNWSNCRELVAPGELPDAL